MTWANPIAWVHSVTSRASSASVELPSCACVSGSGLIVVNPPFGFADEMREALGRVAPLLSDKARHEVRWIVGSE